jgi:hypothetical protein
VGRIEKDIIRNLNTRVYARLISRTSDFTRLINSVAEDLFFRHTKHAIFIPKKILALLISQFVDYFSLPKKSCHSFFLCE